MKKALIILIVFVAAGFVVFKLTPPSEPATEQTDQQERISRPDHKNLAYNIEGVTVRLVNGSAESELEPGSVSTMITEYFGNEVSGDFNGDGLTDTAFLVTQNAGGTGTFFYLVAALSSPAGYTGSNAEFLGDRIAPQTTEFRDGQIIVNFADRGPDEPLAARPTIGVSRYFVVQGTSLVSTRDAL